MTRETLGTIWVCTDCMLLHANGERSEDSDREPLSAIGDADVTAGMDWAEHDESCLRHTMGSDAPPDYECDCETQEFSWSICEGCGTHLEGTRHAMTLWEVS